jgi:hypothetical protein
MFELAFLSFFLILAVVPVLPFLVVISVLVIDRSHTRYFVVMIANTALQRVLFLSSPQYRT